MRRRTLLYLLLALAVPLPALALTSDSSAPYPDLQVSASLDSCGTAADQVVCKIDASWNSLPGATRYTARVTSPDGSVIDYGDVGAGGTSFWVPYVGDGTYTVTVAVYGTKRGPGEPDLLAKASSGAGGKPGARASATAAEGSVAPDAGTTGEGDTPTDDPDSEPTEPSCDEDPVDDDEPPAEDDTPAEEPEAELAPASAEDTTSAEADTESDEPPEADCAEPSTSP